MEVFPFILLQIISNVCMCKKSICQEIEENEEKKEWR